MGARQRLNSLYVLGALMFAGAIGRAAESWAVFVVAAAILMALCLHGGGIRLGQTASRPRRRR